MATFAKAELSPKCNEAIYKGDIVLMLECADESPENELAILDALCYDTDLSDYSYEQLKGWKSGVKSKKISMMLANALRQKEIEILRTVKSLTAEEFVAYGLVFPQRKELLTCYTDSILLPHISELSLTELTYLDDYFSPSFHDKLSEEIYSRNAEKSELLSKHLSDYKKLEIELSERLKYLIEYSLWTYFVEGHKALNKAYSQIAIVPDNSELAADQYQRLVQSCFSGDRIRKTLQGYVDDYCKEINKARNDYYTALGANDYPRMSYKMPEFRINSNVSSAPLQQILEAREQYISSRENVSTGTSVLGWLFGGVVGLVAQGFGDWLAIDDLVTSEYNARKTYMESVQKKLLTSFANYSNTVISGIDKAL